MNIRYLVMSSFMTLFILLSSTSDVFARTPPSIRLDSSLGHVEQTLTGPSYVVPDSLGLIVGKNLHFSFAEFNLIQDQTVQFTSNQAVDFIIVRVTGASSRIDGVISSSIPGSSLVFINSSGITLDPYAQVLVDGDVAFSTSDFLTYDDWERFYSKTNFPSVPSDFLPIELGFLENPASELTVNSTNLSVANGRLLGLYSANVTISSTASLGAGSNGKVVVIAPGRSGSTRMTASPSLHEFTGLGTINHASCTDDPAPFTQSPLFAAPAVCSAELSIATHLLIEEALPGDQFFIAADILNTGELTATETTVSFALPEGISLASGFACTQNGSSVICRLSDIPSNQSRTLEVPLKVDANTVGQKEFVVSTQTTQRGTNSFREPNVGTVSLRVLPKVSLAVLQDTITSANQTNFGVSGSCSVESATVHVSARDRASKTVLSDTLCTNSRFSASTDVSSLLDGTITVLADTIDSEGFTSAIDEARTFKDATLPATPILQFLPSDRITGKVRPSFSGTVTAQDTVTLTVDGVVTGTTVADATGAWAITVGENLSTGEHLAAIVITDPSGNSSQSASVKFVIAKCNKRDSSAIGNKLSDNLSTLSRFVNRKLAGGLHNRLIIRRATSGQLRATTRSIQSKVERLSSIINNLIGKPRYTCDVVPSDTCQTVVTDPINQRLRNQLILIHNLADDSLANLVEQGSRPGLRSRKRLSELVSQILNSLERLPRHWTSCEFLSQ